MSGPLYARMVQWSTIVSPQSSPSHHSSFLLLQKLSLESNISTLTFMMYPSYWVESYNYSEILSSDYTRTSPWGLLNTPTLVKMFDILVDLKWWPKYTGKKQSKSSFRINPWIQYKLLTDTISNFHLGKRYAYL